MGIEENKALVREYFRRMQAVITSYSIHYTKLYDVTGDHVARNGDVVWTDTVSGYEGYASDVGRTWVVGRPSAKLRDLYLRWQEITDAVIDAIRPGATGAELVRIATRANGGKRPWLDHYFLGHTLGLEGGESQRFGSDAGAEVDEGLVLEPGMAVVIEPVTSYNFV